MEDHDAGLLDADEGPVVDPQGGRTIGRADSHILELEPPGESNQPVERLFRCALGHASIPPLSSLAHTGSIGYTALTRAWTVG